MPVGRGAPFLAALAALFLAACAGAPLAPVERLDAIAGPQVVIVGRVDIVPPLQPHEQKFRALNTEQLRNRIFLLTHPEKRVLGKAPELADYDGRIEATPGKTFFVAADAKPLFLRAGVVMLDDGANKAYFPGGLQITPRAGDKAIYVGTIEYRRDEFFNIQGVRIVDDFERAQREFKDRFGGKLTLRKALLAKP